VNFVGQRDRRLDNHTLVTPSSIGQLHASVLLIDLGRLCAPLGEIAGRLSQGARRSADATTWCVDPAMECASHEIKAAPRHRPLAPTRSTLTNFSHLPIFNDKAQDAKTVESHYLWSR
jgi:hypothetical protein